MLKSTYKSAPLAEPLPDGWTQHKAPTGHTYYYNAETKQSTYTRPVVQADPDELHIDFNATHPDVVMQESMKVLDEFHKNNPDHRQQQQRGQGQFTGGRSYQDRSRRNKFEDRPKSKKPILNCEPWVLVMTKFERRFVHNTETKESFWKFPGDVMQAVIEMENEEWAAKKKAQEQKTNTPEVRPKPVPAEVQPSRPAYNNEDDSDSYEEVEVTDSEGEGDDPSSKRPRLDQNQPTEPQGPVEFDEDDIAWQLAQMEEEEADNYQGEADFYNDEDDINEEDEDGLPLTSEDSLTLFRTLLDDSKISPFSTFDALIEPTHNPNAFSIIEDPRWIALPNMSSRRTAFTNWSRDRIAEQKLAETAADESTTTTSRTLDQKQQARLSYLEFLQVEATPKLYWPEFKRKHKKSPPMRDLYITDKDREKLYREYITKLKLSESDRKKELIALLKSVPYDSETWNRGTKVDGGHGGGGLPDVVVLDLRFYLVRDLGVRDGLVEAQISTLSD